MPRKSPEYQATIGLSRLPDNILVYTRTCEDSNRSLLIRTIQRRTRSQEARFSTLLFLPLYTVNLRHLNYLNKCLLSFSYNDFNTELHHCIYLILVLNTQFCSYASSRFWSQRWFVYTSWLLAYHENRRNRSIHPSVQQLSPVYVLRYWSTFVANLRLIDGNKIPTTYIPTSRWEKRYVHSFYDITCFLCS